jgi:hypothetical protein
MAGATPSTMSSRAAVQSLVLPKLSVACAPGSALPQVKEIWGAMVSSGNYEALWGNVRPIALLQRDQPVLDREPD